MLTGVIVLAIMAAIWCDLGVWLTQAPPAWFAVPPLISAAVCLAARATFRNVPSRSAVEEKRVGRIMQECIAIEAVGITLTAPVLANIGRGTFIPAAIAVFVGLHFLPMAWRLPAPFYNATAATMIVAGLLNMLVPARFGVGALSVVCGLALWVTCSVRIATRT